MSLIVRLTLLSSVSTELNAAAPARAVGVEPELDRV